MNHFGYIINPKETALYNLSGNISKIKMHIPLIKDDIIKISDIFNKNNEYIGDVISIPEDEDSEKIKDLLLKYIHKNNLGFICLGDAIRKEKFRHITHERIFTGIKGLQYVMLMYIKKYLEGEICNAEIIFAIDAYDPITLMLIKFFSDVSNYITITGYNIALDENLYEEIFSEQGLSMGYCANYRNLHEDWDILINLSKNINPKYIKSKMGEESMILDPFFLIHNINTNHLKIINNFGLSCEDIIFFNKLNIINNIYSPQLIESIARGKQESLQCNIERLLSDEIIQGQYTVLEQ
ncbi:MAG: hypothetical protein ACOWWR_01460 [Eubacteriales bacterium]